MNRMNPQIIHSTLLSPRIANLLPENIDRQLLPENSSEKKKLKRVILILQALLSTGVCSVAEFSAVPNYKETSHRGWFWNQHLFSYSCQNHLPLFSMKFGFYTSSASDTGYQYTPVRTECAALHLWWAACPVPHMLLLPHMLPTAANNNQRVADEE